MPRGGIEPPTRGFSIHRQHLESMTCVPLSIFESNFCKSLISGSNRAGQVLPHSPHLFLRDITSVEITDEDARHIDACVNENVVEHDAFVVARVVASDA